MSELIGSEVERKIFAGVFKRDEEVLSRRNMLMNIMGVQSAYKNEYQVFYTMLTDKPTLAYDKEYLRLYLTVHRGFFLKNPNIDMGTFGMGDQEPYAAFVDSCINLFDECCKEPIEMADFETSIEKFKLSYMSQESLDILENCAEMLGDGKQYRGKVRQGYDDMRRYMIDTFSTLDKLEEGSLRKGAIVYGVNDTDTDKQVHRKKIGNWGIPSLDAAGSILEETMISVIAPPKNGKSRFSYGLVEELITQGVNCLIWSKENGVRGSEAIIRAKNFNRNFNNGVTPESRKYITDQSIIEDKFDRPEYKELEAANWFNFRHREDYGTLVNMDEDLLIEDFIQLIDEQVMRYNIKFICVDYLTIIDTKNSSDKATHELAGLAYRKMLQYIKNRKIAGIFPAQVKQTAIDVLNKSKDLGALDLRNAGGETSEVIRTPDVNICLYASTPEIKMGKMTLIPLPSRSMRTIDPIPMHIDLGTASFVEVAPE